jgi:hypothetical protein
VSATAGLGLRLCVPSRHPCLPGIPASSSFKRCGKQAACLAGVAVAEPRLLQASDGRDIPNHPLRRGACYHAGMLESPSGTTLTGSGDTFTFGIGSGEGEHTAASEGGLEAVSAVRVGGPIVAPRGSAITYNPMRAPSNCLAGVDPFSPYGAVDCTLSVSVCVAGQGCTNTTTNFTVSVSARAGLPWLRCLAAGLRHLAVLGGAPSIRRAAVLHTRPCPSKAPALLCARKHTHSSCAARARACRSTRLPRRPRSLSRRRSPA